MPNLIVCCDGTWNTDDQTDGNGLPIPTNVAKIYNALDRTPGNGQKSYYHPGVGTSPTRWDRIMGGATGSGLRANVMSAYRWLGAHYTPGDHIFLFGFSRGAYTARAVAGVIARVGLINLQKPLPPGHTEASAVEAIFEADRTHRKIPFSKESYFEWQHDEASPTTQIHFVGVWDTVGSLGIPDEIGLFRWFMKHDKEQFRDQVLSEKVVNARHAVALDEHRINFMPTLWTLSPGRDPSVLKQIWFPGVHADVGGGYGETGLSDGALEWMITEAKNCGASFDPAVVAQLAPSPLSPQHTSDMGMFAKLETRMRPVPFVTAEATSTFHPSTLMRYQTAPLTHGPYWPGRKLSVGESVTVEVIARKRWNFTGVFLETGATYQFSAQGCWMDASTVCDPDGRSKPFSVWRFLICLLVLGMNWIRISLNKLPGLRSMRVPGAARFPRAPLFSLIGSIANGADPASKGKRPDDTFKIGRRLPRHTVAHDGYLYAYANDVWSFYFNNRGSVMLTVTRLAGTGSVE